MPRKGPAARREVAPDPVYQNPLVTQLINKVLLDGKKQTAQRIVYTALEGTRPATDAIASEWYRREVLPVHLGRLLTGEGR